MEISESHTVIFDENSVCWSPTPEYNRVFLQCQQNYANDLLRARGHIFLNEIHDMLGVPRTGNGAVCGWIDNPVDFGIFNQDGIKRDLLTDDGVIHLEFNVDGVIYDKIDDDHEA